MFVAQHVIQLCTAPLFSGFLAAGCPLQSIDVKAILHETLHASSVSAGPRDRVGQRSLEADYPTPTWMILRRLATPGGSSNNAAGNMAAECTLQAGIQLFFMRLLGLSTCAHPYA